MTSTLKGNLKLNASIDVFTVERDRRLLRSIHYPDTWLISLLCEPFQPMSFKAKRERSE